MDADKEGFLRNHRSLTQTAGRAARNVNGKVIFYADDITKSMEKTIEETTRRRDKQLKYNEDHNITPKQIKKAVETILEQSDVIDDREKIYTSYSEIKENIAADPVVQFMSKEQLQKSIEQSKKKMLKASKEMDYITAAKYRDEMKALESVLASK